MDQLSHPYVHHFSTEHFPTPERFDAYREYRRGFYDELVPPAEMPVAFDTATSAVSFNRIILGGFSWPHPQHRPVVQVGRSSRLIRTDDLDFYQLRLEVTGSMKARVGSREYETRSGDLSLIDLTMPHQASLTFGDTFFMAVPSDVLMKDARSLSGRVLSGPLIGLLADYMRALYGRINQLSASDLPRVGQATTHLLRACLQPDSDSLEEAASELGVLQVQRVKRYIDAHLEDPGLNVDKICKDIGISRSTLYRLFESTSGVAHLVLQRRLRMAHNLISDQTIPEIRISAVAQRCGFSTNKFLSQAFKRKFGYSPREARDQAIFHAGAKPHRGSLPPVNATLSDWMRKFAE